MTVTTQASITVDTGQVRDALRAVLPHCEPTKTGDLDAEHRVRLTFSDGLVFFAASNGSTAALAVAEIEDDSREGIDSDDGPFILDISPRQGRHILWAFKAKPTDPEGVEQSLRFDVGVGGLKVTDDGGLFAGETLSFPFLEISDQTPDLIETLGRALFEASGTQIEKPLVTDGRTLALFKTASAVYRQPLEIVSTGGRDARGFVVLCSDRFIGSVSSRFNDDDSLAKRRTARDAWIRRLKPSKLAAV